MTESLTKGNSGMTRIQKQRGHAISEFVAMGAVFVPLALLVPALGKIADMNHAAIGSARYASWERTVASQADKSDAQVAEEVRRRFFSKYDAFIFTDEGSQAGDAQRHQLWRDHRANWMLRNYSDVTVQTTNSDTPGSAAGTIADLMAGFMNTMGRFNGDGDVALDTRGLYRADINVNVGSIPLSPLNSGTNCANAETNQTFLCIRRHHVILGDTWASRDSPEMQRRVRGLVPTSAFERITDLTDIIANVPVLEEFGRFQPGYVAPDTVIPPDRRP